MNKLGFLPCIFSLFSCQTPRIETPGEAGGGSEGMVHQSNSAMGVYLVFEIGLENEDRENQAFPADQA